MSFVIHNTVYFGAATPGSVSGGSSLPSQTGNSGKFLTTDGNTASWGEVPIPQNVWTQDNLVAGDNVSITQQEPTSGGIDEYTVGLFHFNGDCVNSGVQSVYSNTFPQSGESFDNNGKFGKCLYNSVSGDTAKTFLTSQQVISSDNLTMDFWYNPYVLNRNFWLRISDRDINGSTSVAGFVFGPGATSASCTGTAGDNLYSFSVTGNTWTHLAVEIYNGTTYYYKDGIKIYQTENTSVNKTKLGYWWLQDSSIFFLDEVRFSTKARYLGQNFTPPTEPYYDGYSEEIYQINAVLPTTIDGGNADA